MPNPYNATGHGTVAYAAGPAGWGQALVFNGSSTGVTFPDNGTTGPLATPAGVSFWRSFRLKTSNTGVQILLSRWNTVAVLQDWVLYLDTGGVLKLLVRGFTTLVTSAALADNAWHTVEIFFDTTTSNWTVFVDEANVGTLNAAWTPYAANCVAELGYTTFGNPSGQLFLTGQVQEFVCAQRQIQFLRAPFWPQPGDTSVLAAYHFNGDLTDSTPAPASRAGRGWYFAAAGDDSTGDGTLGSPYKTIAKANTLTFVRGDSINFNGGDTFTGNLLVQQGGDVTADVTVQSYGTGRATILCGDLDGVEVKNCGYALVQNLVVTGSGVAAGVTTSTGCGIHVHSDTTKGIGFKYGPVRVLNCVVSGCFDGIMPHTPIITGTVDGYRKLVVAGNTVHHTIRVGIATYGSGTQQAGTPLGRDTFYDVTISGNTVHDVTGDSSNPGTPVQFWNVTKGIGENNLVYSCGYSGGGGLLGGLGGIVVAESDGVVVRHNNVDGMKTNITVDGCGIDIDVGCVNCVVERNFTSNNDGPGYQTTQFSGGSTPGNNVIRNNVSWNDLRNCSAGQGAIAVGGSADMTGLAVLNNTVVCYAAGATITPRQMLWCPPGSSADAHDDNGIRVVNNVFVGDVPVVVDATYARFHGNVYPTGNVLQGGTLAAWRDKGYPRQEYAADGSTAAGVQADAFLRSPAAAAAAQIQGRASAWPNAQLLAGSPAVGAGVSPESLGLDAGALDFHGLPRRAGDGSVDCGACQRGAGSLLPVFRAAGRGRLL